MKLISLVFSFKNEESNLEELITRVHLSLKDLNNWRSKNNAPIPNKLNPFYDQKYVDSLMILINKNKISGKVNKNETSPTS